MNRRDEIGLQCAVDRRTRGADRVDHQTRQPRAAEETVALLDALGIDRAMLWGHSDGAVIALRMAIHSPKRVAAVVDDPSRVLAGTDCGFDTSAGWGRVAEDVVWAKLRTLREGADLASKRLFCA